MTWKNVYRLTGASIFLFALVLYCSTVAETTSFWDAGEFIASAHGLQVMHPPGAPVFMLIGRFIAMFLPAAYVALGINLISVLAAAFSVLLTYLIILQLVFFWQRGTESEGTWPARLIALCSGVIGALTLAASDSFWFNAVEAEVYALAMFFTTYIVWLSLLWRAKAMDQTATGVPGWAVHRYLVLIAYLFGLSIGIHLMSVLTFFFIVLLVFFAYVDHPEWNSKQRFFHLAITSVLSSFVFFLIYPGVVITLPELADGTGVPGVFTLSIIILLIGGLYYTYRRKHPLANLVFICMTALLLGYSTYALIPIRSTANPPLDLNNPETAEELVPYLKREQYGTTPLFKGYTYNDRTGQNNQDKEVLFPRRYSYDPSHLRLYAQYRSDADYFWRYQVGHMYLRYFLWNFVGRAHDTQHAGWATGLLEADPPRYPLFTPSERAGQNEYLALPLLLGLLGMLYHARKDWRSALSVLVLFVITGLGLVVYLNEIPATPRERDYIYVGSYFAFCLWVGIGAGGLLEFMRALLDRHRVTPRMHYGLAGLLIALIFVAVPFRMGVENYHDHDRSNVRIANDFAYNLLMSLDEDAIIFTGGDNDTYPLWYLQEVEGVRRDVRVVCLPLLLTGWYAKQLKNQWAYDAAPLPISFTDEKLDNLNIVPWQPANVELPVDRDRLSVQTELQISAFDTSRFDSPMRWFLEGRPYNQEINLLYPSDQVILNILLENARLGWERPIYFSGASGSDEHLNLEEYLQREGLALRVVPIRHDEPDGRIVPEIMMGRLAHFRFTNMNDPDVYYTEDARGLAGSHYRLTYMETANTLIREGRLEEARDLLDFIMEAVPPDTIPMSVILALQIAQNYQETGDYTRSVEITQQSEARALHSLRTVSSERGLNQTLQIIQAVEMVYINARAFDEAAAFSDQIADITGDDGYRQSPDDFRQLYEEMIQE